ncbi:redoxin family protein [Pedobacter sp. LMG 31462]|uniref:Redoxin family protein n=2 Tax=Pedobacter gandavensis TaxID=2679963 RepID=A0ABR6EQB9_9SPHI|nr:redoxin family protein [Pedobacter gandavensis]
MAKPNQFMRTFYIAFILAFCSANVFAQVLQEHEFSLKGKIANYIPTSDTKSFQLMFNPLEDRSSKLMVNINPDGSFVYKTAIAYAQEVYVFYQNRRYSLLFSPGDSLQLVIDPTVANIKDPRLLKDSIRYQSLINAMQDPDSLNKYDMNDHFIISATHADFMYKLYRKVTNNFSPDSAILFKKFAADRDIISLGKLIIWNVQHQTTGFTRDVFLTRVFLDALSGYQVKEFDALWDEKLISDPWFISKIKKRRNEIVQYLSNQKTGKNATLIADKHHASEFDTVIKKYAGKVIYVDFWAPWCSPCMAAMPASKAIQKRFKGSDVVFIFLANRCSNESWKATIANNNLSGIHFNLSDNEYKILAERFNIVGIPHYLIIDKQGNVINPDAPGPEQKMMLTKTLQKALVEKSKVD